MCFSPGNIHVYTNQGASYSQFYQPRRRRAYERREEVVEENQSQVSDSQSTNALCVSQQQEDFDADLMSFESVL